MSETMAEFAEELVSDVVAHVGKTDGMGYEVEHVQPGAGYSCTEWSSKPLENGYRVLCRTFYPGPFDALAGYSSEIAQTYSVLVGWEEYREDDHKFSLPPSGVDLPVGATKWSDAAHDGPRSWFADFDDGDLAEAFAASLPPYDDDMKPWTRS